MQNASFFNLISILALLVSLVPAPRLQTGSDCGLPDQVTYAPGWILVSFTDEASAVDWQVEFQVDDQVAQATALPGVQRLAVPVGQECTWLEKLNQDGRVRYAEPDYLAQADWAEIPNDPDWSKQWELAPLQITQAWDISTGTPDLLIAVVDSGIQINHPELDAKIWTNPDEIPANYKDDDENGKVDDIHGWRFFHSYSNTSFVAREDAYVSDAFGHGTHVAGTIAAETNNAIGIAGIAPQASLLPVRVLDEYGFGWYSDIAAGIRYAADMGAQVINLSLGGSASSQVMCEAVDYAYSKGALVVAAGGNHNAAQTNTNVQFPAACSHALAVAASDPNDLPASFSNYGPEIDLAAPGTDIYSTWNYSNYLTKSGTSMAAPHVSGVGALLVSYQPGLSVDQVTQALTKTVQDISSPGFDAYTGWGRLDALQALNFWEPALDIAIKVQSARYVIPGDVLTYTIQYQNPSPVAADGIWITDTLPEGMETSVPTQWYFDQLLPKSGPFTLTLPVTITIQEEMTLTNQVKIASTTFEGKLSNNIALFQTRVGIPPNANFMINTSRLWAGEAIRFTNSSTGSTPFTLWWNFGNGKTSKKTEAETIYPQTGSFTVTLSITSPFGSDQTTQIIQILPRPIFLPLVLKQ